MIKLLFGSVVLVAAIAAAPATAADMRTRAPVYKAPQPAPVHGWTGCYIGGNVGYGWARQDFIDPPEGVVDGSTAVDLGAHTADGVVGGGQIGCDYQTGPWVIGVQGMFDWANLEGSGPLPAAFTFDARNGVFSNVSWFATLTGRIGYTVQPGVLAYVKGGAAWVRDEFRVNTDSGIINWRANVTRSGWTIGGGLEWMFAPQWSLFAEYNYMDFGSFNATFVPNLLVFRPSVEISQDVQTVLIGINYRFNRAGP
jgi:outer membrane immunogenic protein